MRNEQKISTTYKTNIVSETIKPKKSKEIFISCKKFEKSVQKQRYGSGNAKITYVEFLNSAYETFKELSFNDLVIIRIYVASFKKIPAMSVNFQIFDDKRINIVSSGFRMAKQKFIATEEGDKYIVEYTLNLPLKQGVYTLQTTITEPVIVDKSANFIDVIPNVHTFKIQNRIDAGMWSCVDLFPKLSIGKIND